MTPNRSTSPSPDDLLPLTTVAFEILLALSAGERHGYAIMRAIQQRTGGPAMHAGTLYRALARLVESRVIEEIEEEVQPGEDERRRYYRLTRLGREVAAAEAHRLEAQVGAARAQGLLGSVEPA